MPSYQIRSARCPSIAKPEDLVADQPATIAQSLAVRNLLRGLRLGLPGAQDVARAMGMTPLTDEELFDDLTLQDDTRRDLAGHAPLWYYVLKEAEIRAGAAHLGPVGGRIVAEVLIGLLAGDPLSYLSVQPTWRPTLPSLADGDFTLSDLVRFAIPAEPPLPARLFADGLTGMHAARRRRPRALSWAEDGLASTAADVLLIASPNRCSGRSSESSSLGSAMGERPLQLRPATRKEGGQRLCSAAFDLRAHLQAAGCSTRL